MLAPLLSKSKAGTSRHGNGMRTKGADLMLLAYLLIFIFDILSVYSEWSVWQTASGVALVAATAIVSHLRKRYGRALALQVPPGAYLRFISSLFFQLTMRD